MLGDNTNTINYIHIINASNGQINQCARQYRQWVYTPFPKLPCFMRECQEEYSMHEINLCPKPYLSKCEEKDLSNFWYKYLRLDMGNVGSAANAICD